MMSRSVLARLGARAKLAPLVDLPLRYQPWTRRRVRAVIARFAEAGPHRTRDLADRLTGAILAAARAAPDGAGRGPRLSDWPILDKERVRDAPERFLVRGSFRVPAGTSGTSGIPLKLWRSLDSIAAEQAFLDHILAGHGLSLARARVAFLRGEDVKPNADLDPPFGRIGHFGRRLILSSTHLLPTTVDWYADAIEAFRPDVLVTYPTHAVGLHHLLEGAGRSVRIPLVMSSSETLMPEAWRAVEHGFGGRVLDYYGQSERVCLATGTTPDGRRFEPAYGRVELVPSADDPVDELGRHVRIVATGYWNAAMPLVRYDTGDRAVVPPEAGPERLEAIALGLEPFAGIAGRTDEYLLTPAGTRLCALSQIPREVPGVLQMQLVQEARDAVTIRVLVRDGFDTESEARLLANARAKIPPTIQVRVARADALERTARGKTPLVIRRLMDSARVG